MPNAMMAEPVGMRYRGGKDGIGGPNQANLEALAFMLWCLEFIAG